MKAFGWLSRSSKQIHQHRNKDDIFPANESQLQWWAFLNDFSQLSTECHWTSNPAKFMQLFISVGDSCE